MPLPNEEEINTLRTLPELARDLSDLEKLGTDVSKAGNIAEILGNDSAKIEELGKLSKVLENAKDISSKDNCLANILGSGNTIEKEGNIINIVDEDGDIIKDTTEITRRMEKSLKEIDNLPKNLKEIITSGKEDAKAEDIAEISIRLNLARLDISEDEISERVAVKMAEWNKERKLFNENDIKFINEFKPDEIESPEDIKNFMESIEAIRSKEMVGTTIENLNPTRLEEALKISNLTIDQKNTISEIFKSKNLKALATETESAKKLDLHKGIMKMSNIHNDSLLKEFGEGSKDEQISKMKEFLEDPEVGLKKMNKNDYLKLEKDDPEKYKKVQAFNQISENNNLRRKMSMGFKPSSISEINDFSKFEKDEDLAEGLSGGNNIKKYFNKSGKFIGDEEALNELKSMEGISQELKDSAQADFDMRNIPDITEFKNLFEGMKEANNFKRFRNGVAAAVASLAALGGFLGPAAGALLGVLAAAAANCAENPIQCYIMTNILPSLLDCFSIAPIWLKKIIKSFVTSHPDITGLIFDSSVIDSIKNDPTTSLNFSSLVLFLTFLLMGFLRLPFGIIPLLILSFMIGSVEICIYKSIDEGWDKTWNNILSTFSSDTKFKEYEKFPKIPEKCFSTLVKLLIPSIILICILVPYLIMKIIELFQPSINKVRDQYRFIKTNKNDNDNDSNNDNDSDTIDNPLTTNDDDYTDDYTDDDTDDDMLGGGKLNNFKSLFILKKFNKYLPYLLLIIMISIVILNKKYKNLSHKIR
tara:strand:- start:3642 stop:5921 length:2280 start_codon:yes stop_codon:yes gene_type:complete